MVSPGPGSSCSSVEGVGEEVAVLARPGRGPRRPRSDRSARRRRRPRPRPTSPACSPSGAAGPAASTTATVVLWRLFWLQSMNTLPGRADLAIVDVTRFGWCFSSTWATAWANSEQCVVGVRRVERHVHLQALRARRLGEALEPGQVVEHLADVERHLGALGDAGAGPGVEVEHAHRGRLDVVAACHRRVDLERGHVGRPRQRRRRVEGAVADGAVAVTRALERPDPLRSVRRAALLEERLLVDAVRVAPERDAAVARCAGPSPARRARSSRSPRPW